MKYLNYLLLLVVFLILVVGASKEYIIKYYPTAIKLSKKYMGYINQRVNRLFRSPSYSY